MDEPGQSPLLAAVLAGAVLPAAHVLAAWVTLRMGWRRGHLRDGLAHGMLLGPLGLLSALLLKRQRRVTEALRIEYARISSDPGHLLFYTAGALFYIGVGLGYGALVYRLLQPRAVIPGMYTTGVLTALALGYLAYCRAKPPSRWIPQQGDYAEYTEDPEYSAQLRYSYLGQSLRQRVHDARGLIALLCCTGLMSGITAVAYLTSPPDSSTVRVVVISVLLAVASAALCVPLVLRKLNAEGQLEQHQINCAEEDPCWLPIIPVELRQQALRLEARLKALRSGRQWRRFQLGASGGLAVGAVIGASAVVVRYPLAWGLAAVAGATLLVAWLWQVSNTGLARLAELGRELAAQQVRDEALRRQLGALVDSYEQERWCVELAFRHAAGADTLLQRSIRWPGRAPWEAQADGASGVLDEDDDEDAADEDSSADRASAASCAAEAAPNCAVAQLTPWAGAVRTPHPQRAMLLRIAGACFSIALGAVLLTAPASRLDPSDTLAALLVLLAAGSLLASLVLWLRALLYPETLTLPAPRIPCAVAGAQALASPAADSPEPVEDEAAPQQEQLHQLLQLDNRLAQRGALQGLLFYSSLAVAILMLGPYFARGIVPASGWVVAGVLWLAFALPLGLRVAQGSAVLYWRRMQLQADLQAAELARKTESNLGYWQAWRRTARNRLRLLWLAGGLGYATLVCGCYWSAGLQLGPHPVPAWQWALAVLGLATAAGYLIHAYRQARAELWRWRATWLASRKEVQLQQYREVLVLRRQAEVLDIHDGFQVQYTPEDVNEAQLEQWVERDFESAFWRDPLEQWLERLRSLALAGAWMGLMLYLPVSDKPEYCDIGDVAVFICTLFSVLALLFWLGRLWRQRALRG